MGLTRLNYDEVILQRILNINSMYPHYWSELLLLAEQLLDEAEREQLHELIFNVERLVLETEVVPKFKEDGSMQWVERIKGRLSLYDIEMALESNADFYAYFQKEDGTIVTKFDVERELDKIKNWLYGKVRERSQNRRFSRMR